MSEVILSINNITKQFAEQEVLKGVSLELHANEVVALIGHSGSGKSTLLRCANLLEPVSSGTISLFGQALQDPSIDEDAVRRHIGMVFQSFNLFPHLSVLDNVMLGPIHSLKESKDVARERATVLLDRIGLASRADDFPDRLSGGQQQRVAIVRALAMKPALKNAPSVEQTKSKDLSTHMRYI
jgi:polar amino acid transport system ATP-binding protein